MPLQNQASRWIKHGMALIFGLALLYFFPFFASHAFAADYYVSQSGGNDSSTTPGNASTPYKTIAKLNAITFSAGDRIYLKRGDAWSESFIPQGSGSSTNWITVDAYGSGTNKPKFSLSSSTPYAVQFHQSVNFTAGTYTISFQAAKRTNHGGQQSFDVYYDTTKIGSFTPTSGSFSSFTTSSFTATTGNHTITFIGTTTTGDNTDFIDNIAINAAGGAGTNYALNATVTASSSVENWGWFKAAVVDGETNSVGGAMGFSSQLYQTSNHTEWLEIDMSTSRTFSKVVLYPRNNAGAVGQCFPIDFKIQSWNGSSWVDKVTVTGYAQPGDAAQAFTWGSSDTTSKIRIYATNLRQDGSNTYMMQFAEIQVQP